MSEENMIKEAQKYLNFDNIPSMKELNSRYRKLALIKHPDKNGNSIAAKEDFQNLLKFYKVLGDYILSQENNGNLDDEEKDNIDIFRHFNFDQKNKFSHTINIENDYANAWKIVLTNKFGDPQDSNEHGLIFKHHNFAFNVEIVPITITLWIMPKKDNQSKLLIQSQKQLANDEFTLKDLPELYTEVRKAVLTEKNKFTSDIVTRAKSGRVGRPPKSDPKQGVKALTKRKLTCHEKDCKYSSLNEKDINDHSKIHFNKYDANRPLSTVTEDENEVDIEISSVMDTGPPVITPVTSDSNDNQSKIKVDELKKQIDVLKEEFEKKEKEMMFFRYQIKDL